MSEAIDWLSINGQNKAALGAYELLGRRRVGQRGVTIGLQPLVTLRYATSHGTESLLGSEEKFAFSNAPIWEVGLSVMGQGAPLYDPYDVRSLHDAFRERFPKSERQPSFPSLQPLIAPGRE